MFSAPGISMEIIFDFTFIHNHLPLKTAESFRQKHILQFLQLFHPNVTFTKTILQKVHRLITCKKFTGENWTTKLDLYYKKYGVGLRFVLVAEQVVCCSALLIQNLLLMKPLIFWSIRLFMKNLSRVPIYQRDILQNGFVVIVGITDMTFLKTLSLGNKFRNLTRRGI